MSKNLETKKKILELLRDKKMTLTDISERLHLAPSTVSQHLRELLRIGAIEQASDFLTRKLKYYETTSKAEQMFRSETVKTQTPNNVMMWRGLAAIAILAIAVSVIVLSLTNNLSKYPFQITGNIAQNHNTFFGALASGSNVTVLLTDPPVAPNGTQEILLNYSALVVYGNVSDVPFRVVNQSQGTLNLSNLTNQSVILHTFKLPENSVINQISLFVSSGNIEIGNVIYPLNISDYNISADVERNRTITNNSELAFDLLPTISQSYQTQNVFVLDPSAVAIVYNQTYNGTTKPNGNYLPTLQQTRQRYGMIAKLPSDLNSQLKSLRSSVSVRNVNIGINNTTTNFSITVYNSNNFPVDIRHIIINGYFRDVPGLKIMNTQSPISDMQNHIQTAANILATNANISQNTNSDIVEASDRFDIPEHVLQHAFGSGSVNALPSFNATSAAVVAGQISDFASQYHGQINFVVLSDGTLILPSSGVQIKNIGVTYGYTLYPYQTKTFTIRTNLNTNLISAIVEPIDNETYSVAAVGSEGTFASTNTVAK